MRKMLIVLGPDAASRQELATLSRQAGYQVLEAGALAPCCLQGPASDGMANLIAIQAGEDRCAGSCTDRSAAALPACVRELAPQRQDTGPAWRLSLRQRRLWMPGGSGVRLTGLEFRLLRLLAVTETGEAVSRRRIAEAFGEDYLQYEQNRLDTLVRRLRRKVTTELGTTLPLHTERARGYSFGAVLIIDL
jgi:hypothetical protein